VALKVSNRHTRNEMAYCAAHHAKLNDVQLETITGSDPSQHEAMERDGRIAALHAFIEELDALNRALMLLYLDERSHAEIAAWVTGRRSRTKAPVAASCARKPRATKSRISSGNESQEKTGATHVAPVGGVAVGNRRRSYLLF
jgi:hypothetical protein